MRLKRVFAGDAAAVAVAAATVPPWLRLRLALCISSVETSQPARRGEVDDEEEEEEEEREEVEEEEEEEDNDDEEQEEEEEEVEAALLLTLGAFCLLRALETRDFLLPSTLWLLFLFPPSSMHCASCAHS